MILLESESALYNINKAKYSCNAVTYSVAKCFTYIVLFQFKPSSDNNGRISVFLSKKCKIHKIIQNLRIKKLYYSNGHSKAVAMESWNH